MKKKIHANNRDKKTYQFSLHKRVLKANSIFVAIATNVIQPQFNSIAIQQRKIKRAHKFTCTYKHTHSIHTKKKKTNKQTWKSIGN